MAFVIKQKSFQHEVNTQTETTAVTNATRCIIEPNRAAIHTSCGLHSEVYWELVVTHISHLSSGTLAACKIISKDRPNLFFSQETHLLVAVANTVGSQVPEFASFCTWQKRRAFSCRPYAGSRHRAPNMVIGDTGHEWECSRKSRLWTNPLYI
jgi:hypothetical protein